MKTIFFKKKLQPVFLIAIYMLQANSTPAQPNLLLNGNFEDINTCTEYNSECGVEAWFYLKDVKAQMFSNDNKTPYLGNNSFGIYFNWSGYTGFSPVIGTILPCRLQKDRRYIFKGMLTAKLNANLNLKPGVVFGEKFYVPKRPFSGTMHPDSIVQIKGIPNTNFYQFEYSFIATGIEKYLTFGTFIEEDTLSGKRALTGAQVVSLVLDNFELISTDNTEVVCADFKKNKEKIYNYNFRHKEMDYSLYGKGELSISFDDMDSSSFTHSEITRLPDKELLTTDTLKLGDVLFDFNKSKLKPEALKMLETFFKSTSPGQARRPIDSTYIEGHTDSIGSDFRNLQLSEQRCESIKYWLQQNNILTADRIQIHPFGKTKPIASNSTPQGRALNRRVEMIIFRDQKK